MGLSDLPFPKSLPEFMKLFRTDADCGAYLELCRWPNGFVCPKCETKAEPYRFEARPGVLRCKSCKADVSLTANTVMERTHTPLSRRRVWDRVWDRVRRRVWDRVGDRVWSPMLIRLTHLSPPGSVGEWRSR